MRGCCALLLLLFASGCGYRFEGGERESISIPYIVGDNEGKLTGEIMRQLAASGLFSPVRTGGTTTLHVEILEDDEARIGFRYDREVATGKRLSNLIGIENRRSVTVAVSLLQSSTEQTLFGPEKVHASIAFDYVNGDSIRDLTFIDQEGHRQKVLRFSLGQLDSIEGAHDSSSTPLFRELASQIADLLIRHQDDLPDSSPR